MTDHATPNLPSRDFEATSQFYTRLGFQQGWRDEGWMILKRGGLTLEFFPHPEGTRVEFFIDFAFRSRLLDMMLQANFDRAVEKLMHCFEARAAALYGPEA